jgi:hypothetical protein
MTETARREENRELGIIKRTIGWRPQIQGGNAMGAPEVRVSFGLANLGSSIKKRPS